MKDTRPHKISELLPTLEVFATYGVKKLDSRFPMWLEAVGVSEAAQGGVVSKTSPTWIVDCLPSRHKEDLLRNTVIRDPLYRFHLDMRVSSVLHAIAKAERWDRLEGLLVNSFNTFTPRFTQLLNWLVYFTKTEIHDLHESHWNEAQQHICGDNSSIFYEWDEEVWGISGRQVSVSFPLLEELYLPLCKKPVFVNQLWHGFDEKASYLLHAVINASKRKEGVLVSTNSLQEYETLMRVGLPIKLQPLPNSSDQFCVGLIGAIRTDIGLFEYDDAFSEVRAMWAIPEEVLVSSSGPSFNSKLDDEGLFEQWGEQAERVAFIDIDNDLSIWPNKEDERYNFKVSNIPQSSLMPTQDILDLVSKPRSQSLKVDQALMMIGNHVYFGFLLQLFLLEALDRELGEDNLILALPSSSTPDDIELETQVFYKPKITDRNQGKQPSPWSFSLGKFDEVISRLAKTTLSIDTVVYPYQMRWGPWSRGLHLFRTADIVVGFAGSYDQWTLSSHVLDRLHGGGLMSGILRRGMKIRDMMHEELTKMWDEKMKSEIMKEEVRGGSS